MKQKRQLVALAVLVTVAGGIWLLYFREEKPVVVTAALGSFEQEYKGINVDNPQLRTEEIERARHAEYKNVGGRNIFSRETPPPRPTPLPRPNRTDTAQTQPLPPPPPPPPVVAALPGKFFGFGTVPNGTVRLAFLTNGDEVYVVPEGELFQNRFRILKIGNTTLDYEDISTRLRGQAQLEEQAAPQ